MMRKAINKRVPAGKHRLPPLPYPYDALEPVISEDTLRMHHDYHHKAYVEGLNKAELAVAQARKEKDYTFISYWENQLAFHGSGHILHSIYWTVLAPPNTGGEPGTNTLNEINRRFGSFDNFITQLIAATTKVEGSGWGILVWNPAWNSLEILTAEKHQNLTQWGAIPILVIDVWEHAYYLDYQYKREEYVRKILGLINWNEVERRLILAVNGKLPLYLEV